MASQNNDIPITPELVQGMLNNQVTELELFRLVVVGISGFFGGSSWQKLRQRKDKGLEGEE